MPGGASAVYEPARAGHAHLICTCCGRTEDVDYVPALADLGAVAEARGIEVSEILLTLRGTSTRHRLAVKQPDR